jgi:hypothetical protein
MNDELQSPYEPPSAKVEPPAIPDSRGSRWAGFGLYWLVSVAGGFVVSLLMIPLSKLHWIPGLIYQLIAAVPLLTVLILGIRFSAKGKTRTAQGLLFGFLSQIALLLLLVAACFGIFTMMGGRL